MLALADAQEEGKCNNWGRPKLSDPLLSKVRVSLHFQQLHHLHLYLLTVLTWQHLILHHVLAAFEPLVLLLTCWDCFVLLVTLRGLRWVGKTSWVTFSFSCADTEQTC